MEGKHKKARRKYRSSKCRGSGRLFFGFIGGLQRLQDELSAEPFILWSEVPARDPEDRNGPEDHAGLRGGETAQGDWKEAAHEIESFPGDWEEERGDHSLIVKDR
jgi:hypothetical protein